MESFESLSLSPDKVSPNKKRKIETNDDGIDKKLAFEYLCVIYILEIRHKSLVKYDEYIKYFTQFESILSKEKVRNNFSVIDDETPITSITIEAILIDRFQTASFQYSSFKYLMKSFERCLDFASRVDNYWITLIPQAKQREIVDNIEQCILTFCGILLSTPHLSNDEDFIKSHDDFQHILSAPPKGRDFPKGFLQKVFCQIEDDSIDDVLQKPINILQNTSGNVQRSNFGIAVNMMMKLSTIERFALFVQDENKSYWIPTGNKVTQSILGGLLSLSFETNDVQPLFNGLSTENMANDPSIQRNISTAFQEYRLIINELQNGIYSVFNNFVRIKNKKCRENVLNLLSYFIYINLDRGKMRFDPKKVSSDGFMLNLNYLLLKLSQPIIKRNMLNKIDANYFLIKQDANYPYMTWKDSTRLSANNNEVSALQNKLYENDESKTNEKVPFGFTTEIFCLTLEALHLGFSCVNNQVSRLQVHIDRLRREARSNPVAGFMINITVQRLEKQLLAQIAHLMDQRFILMVGEFYGFFCKYLLFLSSSQKKDHLSIIPEYFIEDMCRLFRLFLTERTFVMLIQVGQSPFNREEVIQCLIYLMGSSTPIRNIYQRACLCEVLLYFLPRAVLQSKANPNITWNSYQYETHEFNRFESCRAHLVETLLTLYSDVERTGSPGQYYEKFKFRTIITRILKFLFSYRVHQNKLISFWRTKKDKFIAFLNMLINDLIYTLDHGFDGLTEIRQMENEPTDAANNNNWNPLDVFGSQQPQNEAMQRQENISQLKDTIRHYMNLANESIELLQYVCNQTAEPFMDPLILPRIAVLVSVYLDRLANGSELRVRGNLREDYNFNAKFLLTSVVNIFNKLCDSPQNEQLFLDAIVEDEAHFRAKSYEKGIGVLRKKSLMNLSQVSVFSELLRKLICKFEEKRNMECILGEIPSKYLDPIMQTMMRDPVILRSGRDKNKYVMDRKVIERHLMNNPNNPFNREPLSKEDLIPDVALKKEIDEWIKRTLEKHEKETKKNQCDDDGDGDNNEEEEEQKQQ